MNFPAGVGRKPVNQQSNFSPATGAWTQGRHQGPVTTQSFLCSLEDLGETRATSKEVENCSLETTRSSDVVTAPVGKMQGGLGEPGPRCQTVKPAA